MKLRILSCFLIFALCFSMLSACGSTQLIAKLVEDFPDAKELMEYEDYLSHPTKATASALITLALESNWDRVQGMEGYAKYIALRPRAERLGEHGLFGDDDAVDLAAVADELDHYTGNVWTHIISLHREDAERLGYDHADAWRTLLRTHRNDIAALGWCCSRHIATG